jgi:hypothetical protein
VHREKIFDASRMTPPGRLRFVFHQLKYSATIGPAAHKNFRQHDNRYDSVDVPAAGGHIGGSRLATDGWHPLIHYSCQRIFT